jgi:hypothetical protein
MKLPVLAAVPFFFSHAAAALNPSCRPGGNFDLSKWALETPIDNGNGQPLVISAASLSGGNDGCKNGWQDKGSSHQWFFTVSDCRYQSPPLRVCLSRPQRNPPMAPWS